MTDYKTDKLIRTLESVARSLAKIEAELKEQNRIVKILGQCIEEYPDGKTYLNILND